MSIDTVRLLIVIDVGLICKGWLFEMIVCYMYMFVMLPISSLVLLLWLFRFEFLGVLAIRVPWYINDVIS